MSNFTILSRPDLPCKIIGLERMNLEEFDLPPAKKALMARELLQTDRFSLSIDIDGDAIGRIELVDSYSGVKLADSPYRYSMALDDGTGVTYLEGLTSPEISREETRDETVLTITGRAGSGDPRTPPIIIEHRLCLPAGEEYFEERISLINTAPRGFVLRGYRFSFRKLLRFDPESGAWDSDVAGYRLIAVPFRIQPDGKKHDYTMEDIYFGRYECSESVNPMVLHYDLVDRDRGRSEGWAWTDGEYSLLVIKHNPELIEYSMLETERIGDEVYLNFGGADPSLYNEPREARDFSTGKHISFGLTHYTFYEGLWRRGYSMFKEFMAARGHGLPDGYDPPLNWSELYDVDGHHGSRRETQNGLERVYTKQTLVEQARKAAENGCTLLHLDPGWEVGRGTTRWDSERLGEPTEFVAQIKADYGLDVGFRTVGRSYTNEYPGMYRKNANGTIGYYRAYHSDPFYEPCMDFRGFLQEKAQRINSIADAGMKFVSFDEFDWRGACFDTAHGHRTPSTPGGHARHVFGLIQRLKEEHPEILVEAHDPIWPWGVRYLPVYFLHDAPGSFDELWAFEFTWNPLDDLLSGRAISLFYYNLAYDLPLYNHIDMDADNDNCLAFWWYASTVRHLGIGGRKALGGRAVSQTRQEAYRKAMADYLALRSLYVQGIFYGYDEMTHIHYLPESGRSVLNAFNLTDRHVSRDVELNLHELGLLGAVTVEGADYQTTGGKALVRLEIPPMSPLLVRFST